MVVDDVDNDGETVGVERVNEIFKFTHLAARSRVGGKGAFRGEEERIHIAPVVVAFEVEAAAVIEFVEGHKLDGVDAKALEVVERRAGLGVGERVIAPSAI